MKQLLDFIPLVLFLIAYYSLGIREASIVLVIATIIQIIITYALYKKVEKMQLFTAIAVLFFGGLTAYFNDIYFLKIKVTIVYFIFALILAVCQFGYKIILIKKLLGKEFKASEIAWKNLNIGWIFFLIFLGLLNLYVAFYLSNDFWVNFKVFGTMGLTLIAVILSVIYINKHTIKE